MKANALIHINENNHNNCVHSVCRIRIRALLCATTYIGRQFYVWAQRQIFHERKSIRSTTQIWPSSSRVSAKRFKCSNRIVNPTYFHSAKIDREKELSLVWPTSNGWIYLFIHLWNFNAIATATWIDDIVWNLIFCEIVPFDSILHTPPLLFLHLSLCVPFSRWIYIVEI